MEKIDNRIQIRLKDDQQNQLLAIKDVMGFDSISEVVRQLLRTGLSFYKHRDIKIKEIKEDIGIFTIKPKELYPDIKIKRKYLGQ
jgi:Arc/MetJ-type ribon-helix-helix transcriptional regulator